MERVTWPDSQASRHSPVMYTAPPSLWTTSGLSAVGPTSPTRSASMPTTSSLSGWSETRQHMSIGTTGEAKRLEQFSLALPKDVEGSIEYSCHVQSKGWGDWVQGGKPCGTTNEARRMEAVQMRLTGALAETHNVWYRVHSQPLTSAHVDVVAALLALVELEKVWLVVDHAEVEAVCEEGREVGALEADDLVVGQADAGDRPPGAPNELYGWQVRWRLDGHNSPGGGQHVVSQRYAEEALDHGHGLVERVARAYRRGQRDERRHGSVFIVVVLGAVVSPWPHSRLVGVRHGLRGRELPVSEPV